MTIRPDGIARHPAYPQVASGNPRIRGELAAEAMTRRRALERAYPLAKQLAEILELESIEPMAASAKHIRQSIGAQLAEIGSEADDGR